MLTFRNAAARVHEEHKQSWKNGKHQANYPGEVAEAALAHANPNKVEAAYRCTDFLEKRRGLMREWAAFCTSAVDNG